MNANSAFFYAFKKNLILFEVLSQMRTGSFFKGQKKEEQNKKISSSELKVFRLDFLIKLVKSGSKKYYSILELKELVAEKADKALERDYQHLNLGNPTDRQIFDLHSELFKDQREEIISRELDSWFMSKVDNLETMSEDQYLASLQERLENQGIALKAETLKKRVKQYQESKRTVSLITNTQKQLMRYSKFLVKIDSLTPEDIKERKDELNLYRNVYSDMGKMGINDYLRIQAKEQAFGVDEEDLPVFEDF